MMRKVGITGGIGAGKSTVSKIFSLLGVPVYDADSEAKQLMEDPVITEQVRGIFGDAVFVPGKGIDRARLAEIVFRDADRLAALNAIVHPAVRQHFEQWASMQDAGYVLKEAAVMFESGADGQLDEVITVEAPEALRIARVVHRDGTNEAAVRARMANQLSSAERERRAQHVINNDESELLIPQILALHQLLDKK